MTLEQAKEFINSGIREGVIDREDFDNLTDSEIIEYAEESACAEDEELEETKGDE